MKINRQINESIQSTRIELSAQEVLEIVLTNLVQRRVIPGRIFRGSGVEADANIGLESDGAAPISFTFSSGTRRTGGAR